VPLPRPKPRQGGSAPDRLLEIGILDEDDIAGSPSDPEEYPKLLRPIVEEKADVVIGR